ncbi:hypothetical protein V6N11_050709 [Hibiscus sabdariffa]|uniref:Uncharacterized protein n=1 Tax=Hibiscus sabdariffa TaxID=183260 RepID=A0ABR2TAR1_9ROSI
MQQKQKVQEYRIIIAFSLLLGGRMHAAFRSQQKLQTDGIGKTYITAIGQNTLRIKRETNLFAKETETPTGTVFLVSEITVSMLHQLL